MPTNSLYIFQNRDGYRYNSDTLCLYDFVLRFKPNRAVLDVGCGSGILGLLIKRDFDVNLTSLDIQSTNIDLTKKNAEQNRLKLTTVCIDFLQYETDEKFDFVVSNPPFYHEGSKKSENESLKISRYSSSLPLEKFIRKVSSVIKPRGSFIFCYDAKQCDYIFAKLLEYKFKPITIRFVHTKKDKNSKLVLICARKSSKTLCEILPPLYMDSFEMEQIYKIANTWSLEC